MGVRLDDRNPMSTADVLVTVANLEGYFSEFSGIEKSISRPAYSDGLSASKRFAATGTEEFADVTIAKAFDPEKDSPILAWIKEFECGLPFDMTVRPVKRCAGGVEFRGNKSWTLSGCKIKSWSNMQGMDTASGDQVVKLTIVFTVESASWS